MHLHVAMSKSRSVNRKAPKKYDVTHIKIAAIDFEKFLPI